MSPIRRLVPALLFSTLILVFTSRLSAEAPADASAPEVATSLCNALLASMKMGTPTNYAARRDLLAPEITRDLDLPFMTRLVVGQTWSTTSTDDRKKAIDAFSAYSIATYAQRFKGFSGERFEVDPTSTPQARGDVIVHTKLYTGDPNPVQLDYLMRRTNGQWKILDVYLSGTISEMAARRSEYSTLIRQGGTSALVDLLNKKTAEFSKEGTGS